MKKISGKIVEWSIVAPEPALLKPLKGKTMIRPDCLKGETYRLKSHVYEHSFYVTINDYNNKPFEIFINTRNEDCAMWLSSLSLSWSAIFREMDDINFLLNGMVKVIDPKGSHSSHKRFHKSIVAEIGYILQCKKNGVKLSKSTPSEKQGEATKNDQVLECPKCQQKTLVKRDGCSQCTDDGCCYSSCE